MSKKYNSKDYLNSEVETAQTLADRAQFLRLRGLAINARTLHAEAALSSADIIAAPAGIADCVRDLAE